MKKIILAISVTLLFTTASAQHQHHSPQPKKSVKTKQSRPPKAAPAKPGPEHMQHKTPEHQQQAGESPGSPTGHAQHIADTAHNMSHAYSINLPMNRNGSGTGWLPDNSPMYGKMLHSRKWMYMLHGNIFLRYNKQDVFEKGSRGDEKIDAPNWLMAMGQRRVGQKGLFHFSTMLSLDAAIAGGSGYPLLFQSGETWQGKPLVDRQHPHDLFSELSVSYAHAFNKNADVFVYLGYPGEPALGSVAFMHRPSALTNPDAPLSHHWNDGTHITFGVATLGFRYRKFKLEASSFTGREPDEDRWGFDKPRFDSRSARLSFNPDRHWAFQLSHGFVKSPEITHPGEDVYRTTASAVYSYSFSANKLFNATALWGLNKSAGHEGENAFLLEASYAINRWNIYGRYEHVEKSVEELDLEETVYGEHSIFAVNALTAGVNYDVLQTNTIRTAIGIQGSVYMADERLDNLYGNNPMAAQVYIRLYPTLMR